MEPGHLLVFNTKVTSHTLSIVLYMGYTLHRVSINELYATLHEILPLARVGKL